MTNLTNLTNPPTTSESSPDIPALPSEGSSQDTPQRLLSTPLHSRPACRNLTVMSPGSDPLSVSETRRKTPQRSITELVTNTRLPDSPSEDKAKPVFTLTSASKGKDGESNANDDSPAADEKAASRTSAMRNKATREKSLDSELKKMNDRNAEMSKMEQVKYIQKFKEEKARQTFKIELEKKLERDLQSVTSPKHVIRSPVSARTEKTNKLRVPDLPVPEYSPSKKHIRSTSVKSPRKLIHKDSDEKEVDENLKKNSDFAPISFLNQFGKNLDLVSPREKKDAIKSVLFSPRKELVSPRPDAAKTEKKLRRIRKGKQSLYFGIPLEETFKLLQDMEQEHFIFQCISFLEKHGLETEGVFRVSPSAEVVQELCRGLDSGGSLVFDDKLTVHEVAGLIKRYFSELPNRLLSSQYSSSFKKTDTDEQILSKISTMYDELPELNKIVLFKILALLQTISEHSEKNKMTPKNLSVCMITLFPEPEVNQPSSNNPLDLMAVGKEILEITGLLTRTIELMISSLKDLGSKLQKSIID
uniref:Rho-GAP domain-containing protein n=1 Tax=Arcella intermedia TaxID=1963864 RepID=A0A6B2L132_9EUKA